MMSGILLDLCKQFWLLLSDDEDEKEKRL